MDSRVLEILNNYPDGYDQNQTLSMGGYCVIGYYDALEADFHFGGNGTSETVTAWKNKNDFAIRYLVGRWKVTTLSMCPDYSEENIDCINNRKEKESRLWDEKYERPLLVVSMIRTKPDVNLSELVHELNRKDNMVAYYSYEDCEAAAVFRTDSYHDVLTEIRKIYATGNVLKIYSLLAIPEQLLSDKDALRARIQDEDICVRMNVSMRSRAAMTDFYNKLKNYMEDHKKHKDFSMQKYDLLGDDDLVIEINHIPLATVLPLYAPHELLNHQNENYSAAFFNVESRFLLPEGTDTIDKVVEIGSNEDKLKVSEQSNWIQEDLEKLTVLFCNPEYRKEEALLSYIMCMIRLLNSIVQIKSSDFHRYERKILLDSMQVFMEYFIDRVMSTLDLNKSNLWAKEEGIQEIERAVCRVTDIYENVLNGTANTDKQMFMSFPVNSSIYEISPKLYAFYADLIFDLQELFDPKRKYAFFLNPTLKRALQEEVLFGERQEKGKVVIIDVPVRMLDDTQYLPLYMIHEIFHVLTTQERNRKMRAMKFYACLLYEIYERLFQGVLFFESEDYLDLTLKNSLIQKWMMDGQNQFYHLYMEEEWDSRVFYGSNITNTIAAILEECVNQIDKNALPDIVNELRRNPRYRDKVRDLNFFNEFYQNCVKQAERIRENVRNILCNNDILYLAKRQIYIFKESYADLAMLLIGEYPIEHFDSAFLHAAQYDVQPDFYRSEDQYMEMRKELSFTLIKFRKEQIVQNGILTDLGEEVYKRLSCQLDIMDKKYEGTLQYFKKNQYDYRQDRKKYAIMSPTCFRCVVEYLFECKASFNMTLEMLSDDNKKRLEQLRHKLKRTSRDIITGSDCILEAKPANDDAGNNQTCE